ncbi:MAG TPA: fasciclin domain-containing protein [Paludibacter sp.]
MKRIASVKQSLIGLFIFLATMGALLTGCDSDDVGGNLYTKTDKMLGEYLRNDSANYSEFTTLLDTTHVFGLLNSYGSYTCFVPNNQAMLKFYALKGKKSLADFPMDTLKMIAYDHIINGTVVKYINFVNGRLPVLSMSDRYISIFFSNDGQTFVNKTSQILGKEIEVHNGVIHPISEVLNPTRFGVVDAISKDSVFSLFYQALVATGMSDSLLLEKDETYDPTKFAGLITTTKDMGQWFYHEIPTSRKYGYTVLMESNSTLKNQGITDLQSLKDYAASVYNQVYPLDAGITNITDRRNSLNRFISYHLINKQLSYSKFIDAYDVAHMLKTRDMYEYIETMCPNTLMEVKKDRAMSGANLINYISETGRYVQIVIANSDKDATNGVYHEIDGMLVYDNAVEQELSSKRLRFEAASLFPELTNNNMRGRGTFLVTDPVTQKAIPNLHFQIPRGYISRISSSEQTVVGYLCAYEKFQNYEGDEIFLSASAGKLYDFSVLLPPVPAGTYEVRFGYLTNGKRGVAQLYLDGIPAGVPLNLNTKATDASIGYQFPHTLADDYEGYENDKMMRNRGYMKGPACFKVPKPGWTSGENARYSADNLRKIMGTYTFKSASNHVLTVKGLSGGEFMFDYLEFVPTSALESEDIY